MHTQRQSPKSKKYSVVKRKKVVLHLPRESEISLLPPSPATSSPTSSSSSSSSSTSSSSLSSTTLTPVTEEEYDPTTLLPMGALRALLQSPSNLTLDVEEEEEEDTVYVDRRSYAEKMDFFENFEEIPDIENISENVSVADVVDAIDVEVAQLSKGVLEDEGEFVDPLLGIRVSEKSLKAEKKITQVERFAAVKPEISEPKPKSQHKTKLKTKTKPEPEPEPIPKTAHEFQLSDLMITESQTLGSQASELELILPDDAAFFEVTSKANILHMKEMDDVPEDMLESLLEPVDVKYEGEDKDKDIDWMALAREHEAQKVRQQTKEFLTTLIRKVVERSEFRNKDGILTQNLDKRKLLVEMAEKCLQFETEVNINYVLEHKVVNVLQRKKLVNQIKPSKFDLMSKPKYHAALWEIDKQLARESATKNKYENIKKTLQEEIRKSDKEWKKQIQAFEMLIKLKLSGNDLENLNHRILPHIADMSEFRKKISATRYKLILLEDTHAELNNELDRIKDLGSGYTVEDFYSLHEKNQELQKKIEERDGNLNKLHSHLQKNIHILSHYAETKDRLSQFVQRQRFQLKELMFEHQRLRRHLRNLNMKRQRTRQEIKEMSFKAGLLDKPLLMYDYDKTVEQIEADKEKIAYLRETLATIEHKIKILEESLSNNKIVSYSIR